MSLTKQIFSWIVVLLTYSSGFRYFDDEDESFDGAYQPAPGSPGPQRKEDSDSDEDPLDAFMAGIEQEVRFTSQINVISCRFYCLGLHTLLFYTKLTHDFYNALAG